MNDTNERQGRPCAGNSGISCSFLDCDCCGWNPAVSAERIAQIRDGALRISVYGFEYYPVPRAGDDMGVETENAD